MDMRLEKDSMGELEVPSKALYGGNTRRAQLNFPISNLSGYNLSYSGVKTAFLNFIQNQENKSSSIEQFTQSDIVKNISKKHKNIFVTPTLETCNQLSNELIDNEVDIDFYQKTGGIEEINNFINSNNEIDFDVLYHSFLHADYLRKNAIKANLKFSGIYQESPDNFVLRMLDVK